MTNFIVLISCFGWIEIEVAKFAHFNCDAGLAENELLQLMNCVDAAHANNDHCVDSLVVIGVCVTDAMPTVIN